MTTTIALAEQQGVIDYTRQRDWIDPATLSATINMVGCGGIGSPTALLLAKMGMPKFRLIDFDNVEPHNLPNQMFALEQNGMTKTQALAENMRSFAVPEIDAFDTKMTEEGWEGDNVPRLNGVTIAGLDSMEARVWLWNNAIKRNIRSQLYIDARLGGEIINVYAVNPMDNNDIERYEESLYTDGEAKPLPCTRRIVLDVGFQVASLIGRLVRRHLAGEPIEKMIHFDQSALWVGAEK